MEKKMKMINRKSEKEGLLRKFVKLGMSSTDSTLIGLAKQSAKRLKIPFFPQSERIYTNRRFPGFQAQINCNYPQLKHWIRSEIALSKRNKKKLSTLKNHPYLKGSPELIIRLPLEATEDKKREFLSEASKHFKDLVKKYEVQVNTNDTKYNYPEYKKASLTVKKITHQKDKGKRDKSYKEELNKKNKEIVEMVKKKQEDYPNHKKTFIFELVSQELAEKGKASLKPNTVKNRYYAYKNKCLL